MAFDVAGILIVAGGAPQDTGETPLLFSLDLAARRTHVRITAPVAVRPQWAPGGRFRATIPTKLVLLQVHSCRVTDPGEIRPDETGTRRCQWQQAPVRSDSLLPPGKPIRSLIRWGPAPDRLMNPDRVESGWPGGPAPPGASPTMAPLEQFPGFAATSTGSNRKTWQVEVCAQAAYSASLPARSRFLT